ncbi:MAG: Hsp20 family protein [Asticcacaulis sp.]
MSRYIVFDSPFLLGFDETRSLIERLSRAPDNYPPYNVEALSADHLRLSVAVAGFTPDTLRLSLQGQQLTLQAFKEPTETAPREFIHRGIAQRGFTRSFVVGEGFLVEGAVLEHGLLHIDLRRPQVSDELRIIPIRTA